MPLSSSFFNHGRPTCHFVENFLVLDSDFSYSFDWSQVAFGAFSFFFSSTTLETPEIYFQFFFILYAISLRENTQWSERWERTENHSLATLSSTWQTEDYFFNPKETQWKHLLYIWSRFFIDKPEMKSLQFASKLVCSSQERSIYLITDGSMVTSSVTLYK